MLLSRLLKRIINHKSPYHLRPAQEMDTFDLYRTCWTDRDIRLIEEFIQRSLEMMHYRYGYALVAEYQGQVVAFGLLTVWPQAAEISDLIVSPLHQGRGVATAIIKRLTEEAWNLGAYKLEIGAANSNTRAYNLYRHLGFIPEREIKLNLGKGLEPVTYLAKYPDN